MTHRVISGTVILLMVCGAAAAQEPSHPIGGPGLPTGAVMNARIDRVDSGIPAAPEVTSAAEASTLPQALRPTTRQAELLRIPPAATPTLALDEAPTTLMQAPGGGTGLGFMIAGGAALVAGLLIGGTAGDIIAIGGAVLGVWGIIVYF